jgi:antitoxin component YwqK of YwqJK toxin-antitoxin module
MKMIILLCLYAIQFIPAYGQKPHDTIQYPLYRKVHENYSKFSFEDYTSFPRSSTIPCIGCDSYANSAKDGIYVAYYEISDVENKIISKNKPYCYFSLKNHQLNGKAIYFSPRGDTIAKGYFKENKQVGNWKIIIPFYIDSRNYKKNYGLYTDTTTNWCTYYISIEGDSLNGSYNYYENDILITSGYLKNNKPIGEWKIYHTNGILANKFNVLKFSIEKEVDKVISVSNIMEYPESVDSSKLIPFYPRHQSLSIALLPYGNHQVFFPGLTYSLIDSYRSANYDQLIFSGTYSLSPNRISKDSKIFSELWYSFFESYYSNGQLRFKIEMDEKGNLIEVSNVYDSSGNIEVEHKIRK